MEEWKNRQDHSIGYHHQNLTVVVEEHCYYNYAQYFPLCCYLFVVGTGGVMGVCTMGVCDLY